MLRLRRLAAISVIAGLLVAQPVRPAHAFVPAILAAAVSYVGEQLLSVFTGTDKLGSVLLAIETQLPIMQSMVEMRVQENMSKARGVLEQERLKRMQYAESLRERPHDFRQAACQAATPIVDLNIHRQRVETIDKPLVMGDIRSQSSRGDGMAGRTGLAATLSGRTKTSDDIRQRVNEANLHACRYGTANDKALRAALNCPDDLPAENNPYAGKDTNASTVTASSAFTEDRHYVAAADYCYALTGHTLLPYAQGRARSENVDNIKQFLVTLSDSAARDLSIAACAPYLLDRVPLDNKYAVTHPEYKELMQKLASAPANAGGRSYADMDKTARGYLLSAGGYTEVAAGAKRPGEAGAKELVKGQLLSRKQKDEATFIYRWFAPNFTANQEGQPNMRLGQMIFTRVANLQLQWRSYEQLELQTMNEAVQLAKMVRASPGYGDPGTSAPIQ